MKKERMSLRNSSSKRVARTKRRIGQTRLTAKAMPSIIHLRAWTLDGNLVGVAQSNDRFMVALFDSSENALGAPHVFTGSSARDQAASLASKLTGRPVSL